MAKRWTVQEDEKLKDIYPKSSKADILQAIDKPWGTIHRRAIRLGLRRDPALINEDRKKRGPRKDAWTPEEENKLKELFENNTKQEILKHFDRPWQGIHIRAKRLGLTRNPDIVKQEMIEGGKNAPEREDIWTKIEDETLVKVYPLLRKKEIQDKLPGRTWSAIRIRATKLGVTRDEDKAREDNTENSQKSLLRKYGVRSAFALPETKKKIKDTLRERYGVDYPMQADSVKEKCRQSVKEKYGVENVFQSEDIKQTSQETCLEKFGVEYPTKSESVRAATISTNQSRYGVNNPFQLTSHIQECFLAKYGVRYPAHVEEFIEKKKKTNLRRYGTEYPCQNLEVRRRLSKKLQSPEVRAKKHRTMREKGTFHISDSERKFYDYLLVFDDSTRAQELHPILKHTMDFYMPRFNLWIQYDGVYWHGKNFKGGNGRQTSQIKSIMRRDAEQNKRIPNLLRFWEDDVHKAIASGTLVDLLRNRIEQKVKDTEDSPVCHQFLQKIRWYNTDVASLAFDASGLKASDFILSREPLSPEISKFIEKYEWLGTIGQKPKWCFCARYRDILGAVVLINEPTAYSKNLGKDTPIYEALIQRGASASWTPKNLSSRLIMFSCKWMVRNTKKRFFVGYADPSAKERGVIYRACNFDLIDTKSGSKNLYRDKSSGKVFSAQSLRRTSALKRWCKKEGIKIEPEWIKDNGFKDIHAIPSDILNRWKEHISHTIEQAEKIPVLPKSKFGLVLGKDRREQRMLDSLKCYTPLRLPSVRESSSLNVDNLCSNRNIRKSRETQKKTEFILKNHSTMSRREIATNMNESERWVKRQINALVKKRLLTPKR